MVALSFLKPSPCASAHYTLTATEYTHTISITMRMLSSFLYSSQLQQAYPMLKKYVPSVLRSQCFNAAGIPFKHEAKDTELGHLFEHILIEFMCLEKLEAGYTSASFSGVTQWNWKKNPKGTFHIEIAVEKHDRKFLYMALKKTIKLMNMIIDSQYEVTTHVPYTIKQKPYSFNLIN